MKLHLDSVFSASSWGCRIKPMKIFWKSLTCPLFLRHHIELWNNWSLGERPCMKLHLLPSLLLVNHHAMSCHVLFYPIKQVSALPHPLPSILKTWDEDKQNFSQSYQCSPHIFQFYSYCLSFSWGCDMQSQSLFCEENQPIYSGIIVATCVAAINRYYIHCKFHDLRSY